VSSRINSRRPSAAVVERRRPGRGKVAAPQNNAPLRGGKLAQDGLAHVHLFDREDLEFTVHAHRFDNPLPQRRWICLCGHSEIRGIPEVLPDPKFHGSTAVVRSSPGPVGRRWTWKKKAKEIVTRQGDSTMKITIRAAHSEDKTSTRKG